MRAEQQVGLAADRLAHQAAEFLAEIERFQRGLARVEGRIGRGGIELHGREALLHIFGGALGRKLGIPVDALVLAVLSG